MITDPWWLIESLAVMEAALESAKEWAAFIAEAQAAAASIPTARDAWSYA